MKSQTAIRPGFAPPGPLELLLQATLAPPPLAQHAFECWRQASDFDQLPEAHFRLLGELARVVEQLDPDWREKPRVLGVQKYCWSNNIHIIRTALPVLDSLIAAGIRFVLLKGGGIIARDPAAMHWRMLRDIDLLVATADIPATAEILVAAGWRPMTGRLPGVLRAQPFDRRGPANPHAPSRIEIDLHHRVLHPGRYGTFDADFLERSEASTLLGRAVRSPHLVDQALAALSQALMFSEHPNYVWIGDAVRAMQAPGFDWNDFWKRVSERDIVLHAQAVVDYLQATFAMTVPAMPSRRRPGRLKSAVHAAEMSAMGRSRAQRGLSGRLAMFAAEYWRSRSVRGHVRFRTDYTIRMRPSFRSARPLMRVGNGFAWDAVQGPHGISIFIRFAEPVTRRIDLDLWAGERWVHRLKVKPVLAARLLGRRRWEATVVNVHPAAIDTMKLEASSMSRNEQQ